MSESKYEKKLNQLDKARKSFVQSGINPHQKGYENKLIVFEWIYKWGFTTSMVSQLLLNRTSGGYLKKLAEHKWLVSVKTESGLPRDYFTLSKSGLEETEQHTDQLLKYVEIDPFKVDQKKIRHSVIAQMSTLNGLKSGHITEYETERMFSNEGDKPGLKRPDIIWTTKGGQRLGIEVELSAKWDRDLDNFILGILRSLKSNNIEGHNLSRFVIISDSEAIIRRYANAMQSGEPLSIWVKNERNHWVIQEKIEVPDWLITRVDFKYIER